MDIHHQGFIPGGMSGHGGRGGEAPAVPSCVHAWVQGGDRGAVPARGTGRPGRGGLGPDRDRGARRGQAGGAGRRDQPGRRPDQRRAQGNWPGCGPGPAGCGRTRGSSGGPRLFSRRRPGELLPPHRGGESAAARRENSVRAADGRPGQGRAQAVRGRYGAPRSCAELRRRGRRRSRGRVARLVRRAGLAGRAPGRREEDHHPRPGRRGPR